MADILPLPIAISVLLSDNTKMGCELLCAALNSDQYGLNVVGGVISCKELVEVAVARQPDVALVSVALQEGPNAGFQALKELHSVAPKIACVLLMDAAAPDLVIEAFRHGAKGVFLRRDGPVDMLRRCIRVVAEGQIWISNSDLLHLVKRVAEAAPMTFCNAKGDELLTKREKEVVTLVAQGLTNREIAQHMRLSEHTVKNYLLRVFDKLGVSSRAELIVYTLNRKELAS